MAVGDKENGRSIGIDGTKNMWKKPWRMIEAVERKDDQHINKIKSNKKKKRRKSHLFVALIFFRKLCAFYDHEVFIYVVFSVQFILQNPHVTKTDRL